MDSMRSLNRSLPNSKMPHAVPPEQLLQAFKTAALSVTNLYKSAVTDQSGSRQAGYQDALEDLLSFLDTENLGVQDGEGWQIRQWATERFERAGLDNRSESDEERAETERRARTSSPSLEAGTIQQEIGTCEEPATESPTRPVSVPPPSNTTLDVSSPEQAPMYRFTAAQPAQSGDVQMQTQDITCADDQQELSTETQQAPVKVEVIGRGSRTPHRHPSSRHVSHNSTRDFTFTAGTKRKIQFPDFFDISHIGNGGRDNSGSGGKRGRFA